LLSGCGPKKPLAPATYQLKRISSPETLLVPPNGALPGARSEINLQLGKARLQKKSQGKCQVDAGAFHLSFQKSRALLRVSTSDMSQGPDRITLSLLDDINKFRAQMMHLETAGCLKPGEAAPLLTRVIEGIALPSRVAYYLRHGTSINEGFVDLLPPFRIKVVVPIREQNKVVGFETAWYILASRGRNQGHRLTLERAETFVGGKLIASAKPSHASLLPPERLSYYRLFFLTRRSAQDHDILLLGARSREAIEGHSAQIRKEGEGACSTLQSSDVHCLRVPMHSAISAELRVKAKDRFVYIPFGGTVSDALRAAGLQRTSDAVPTLKVSRPYGKILAPVQFDASRPDVLTLVLVGGEEISW
jgi:hypothetical protein